MEWTVQDSGMQKGFVVEIWDDGEPDQWAGADNDFYEPNGTEIGSVDIPDSNYEDREAYVYVTDSKALGVGEHTIHAWVRRKGTSPPNAWAYNEEACTFDVLEVNDVNVDPNVQCVDSNVTFTGVPNPSGTLRCMEWQRQYKATSGGSWADDDDPESGGTAKILNTSKAGYYRYRAKNCAIECSGCDWVDSNEAVVVAVDEVDGPSYVCVTESANLEAKIAPSGESYPDGEPHWSIVSNPAGASPSVSPEDDSNTTTLSGLTEPGPYVVRAKCGEGDGNTITVTAVDVLSIEIKYDDANWADVTDANIVVLKGTKYLFRVWPDPEGASWPSPPQWSGAASGVGIFKLVTFNTEGTHDVTVKCCSTCGDGKTVNIEVVEPNVYQIGFDGDHTLYETPSGYNGWADGSSAIVDPVYDSDVGDSCAVCVTKNSGSLSLYKVKLKIDEALTYATTIRVDAAGTEDWDESADVNFPGASTTSNEASLDITGNIINEVKEYYGNFQIQWKYKVPSGTNTYYTINTTSHTVYVKWGDSDGGHSLTQERIAWLCGVCNADSNLVDCSHDIWSRLSTHSPPWFDLDEDGPANKWWLMSYDPNSNKGNCKALAELMQDMHELLGCGSGEIGYVYASKDANDTDVYETETGQNEDRTCSDSLHGFEMARFRTGSGWNNYQTVFHANGWYYAVKETKRSVAFNILKDILGANTMAGNHQAWRYYDGFGVPQTCIDPGPCPIPVHAAIPE